MVEKEVLAQSWAIHGSNESLHFENRNLPNVSLKQFSFEFLTISKSCNLSLVKKKIDLVW
jgi:hypothetical protein